MKNAVACFLLSCHYTSQNRLTLRNFGSRLVWLAALMALACLCFPAAAQTGQWAWMNGTSTLAGCAQPPTGHDTCVDPVGIYGTLGTPAAANVPGSRGYQATWTDKSGNLWLFGGMGFDSTAQTNDTQLNDLWEFSPSTRQWTWIGGSSVQPYPGSQGVYGTLGVADSQNIPGGRSGSASWADNSGRLWLFGGVGVFSGFGLTHLNDLWMFDSSIREWTWTGGSSALSNNGSFGGVCGTLGSPGPLNIPGGREGAVTWVDAAGNLWLFGGNANDCIPIYSGWENDLWKFDISTKQWTWMGGGISQNNRQGPPGVYGTLGVPAAGNIPGGRYEAMSWTDKDGNFWLFGGYGFDSAGHTGALNDLWEFKPSTGEWTWMNGSSTLACTTLTGGQLTCSEPVGVYGTLGTPGVANTPGGRYYGVAETDASGHLWLFGGRGTDSTGTYPDAYLNDLWMFDTTTHEWTWMGGGDTVPAITTNSLWHGNPSVVGTLGVPGPANIPGGRAYLTGWKGADNNLWLFGGFGFDASGNGGQLNDLWEYQSVTATPTFSPAPGTFTSAQTVTIDDATTGATIYYTTDGTTPTSASTNFTGAITVSATQTIKAIAITPGYADSSVASATYTINLPPTFTFAASASSLTIKSAAQGTVTLTVTPQYGFTAAVSFACSGLPAGASCAFNPTTVTPTGAAATTTLTITAQTLTAAAHPNPSPFFPEATLALAVCFFGWRKRRTLHLVLLSAVAVVGLGLLSGCGGGGSSSSPTPPSTPTPATSTITVTATSGAIQQTATVSVTVK